MMSNWWNEVKTVSVVVDNDSWILPYAQEIVDWANENGNKASLCRMHDEIPDGHVAFYLGCVKITPESVLARNECNLVVHASDLPKGRGFSPLTWLVLEGKNRIPVCLLHAVSEVDAGPIIYKDTFTLQGSELLHEMREILGNKTVELCQRFLNEETLPMPKEQEGEHSIYARRGPKDSRLDPNNTIAEQFDLLRTVDNDKYPAFFEHRGKRYKLLIEEDERDL